MDQGGRDTRISKENEIGVNPYEIDADIILSRGDPTINVWARFGFEEDLGRSSALGRRKKRLLWAWAKRAQYLEQLPPSLEGRRIRALRVPFVP
ncbi:hypothetical protein PIB30_015568 [Stylosanthes scabra]|uniref:Uncharacterized protein n=1 Tax=Stylosanthes scabra TaxID=79078 RepID=A0ABU6Q813_9FABA|nr:hypothetical protein [Stylosanthes scabra]